MQILTNKSIYNEDKRGWSVSVRFLSWAMRHGGADGDDKQEKNKGDRNN